MENFHNNPLSDGILKNKKKQGHENRQEQPAVRHDSDKTQQSMYETRQEESIVNYSSTSTTSSYSSNANNGNANYSQSDYHKNDVGKEPQSQYESQHKNPSSGSNFTKASEGNDYELPSELKGRSNEDIAGKKTQAKAQTSSDKWTVNENAAKTTGKVATTDRVGAGNKHAYSNDRSSAAYHIVDPNENTRYTQQEDGILNTPNARVTDESGRILETGEGVGGHSAFNSALASPFKRDTPDGEFEAKKTASNRDIEAIDVSKVNRQTGIAKRVGATAQSAIENRYQEADAVQGQQAVKDEIKKFSVITGASALGHAAQRAAIHGGITQRTLFNNIDRYSKFDVDENRKRLKGKPGIVKTKDAHGAVIEIGREKTALRRGLDQAESEAGGKFVTSTKNSYGSLVKDIKNNLFIIDNHFKKHGLDISGYTEGQIKAAISKGYLVNKVGKNVMLSESDKALLNERLKLMKKKRALQATGTWKEDAGDLLASMYSDTDFYQGYRVAKTTAKTAKAVSHIGKATISGAVKGTEALGAGVAMLPNSVARAGVNVVGGVGGLGSKRLRKWRYNQNAKFRSRNAKIRVGNAKLRSATGKVINNPGKAIVGATGKGISKLAGATIGKTRFGKTVSKGAGKAKGTLDYLKRKRLNVNNKVKNNVVTRVAGAPVKAAGKVIEFIGNVKLVAAIVILILIVVISFIIVITSAISNIVPAGADITNFENGQATLWEQSKDGMNQELEAISSECTSWINSNYRAYRKKRLGRGLSYSTSFVFAGFEFDGPDNNVTERTEKDTDASKAYSESMNDAKGRKEKEVSDKATAANGPYSGSAGTLTRSKGTINGPSGKETYYNLDMANCVHTLDVHCKGKVGGLSDTAHYFVRSDGVKCYGDPNGIAYVMVAANLSLRPKGTIVMTSLGPGIVADTGTFAYTNPRQLDIAVAWTKNGNNDKYKTINSGTVDTWGGDLNSGAMFVDGKKACASNYLRSILAMATTATGNEDDPDNNKFYIAYCRHLIRNSWNYTKYVAANKWLDDNGTEVDDEPPRRIAWTDPYLGQGDLDHFANPAFEVAVMDEEYNTHGHLIGVTFSVKCRFLNCGLWGEGDYNDDGGQAGTGTSPDKRATSVGMFDVETYDYTTEDLCGNTIKNEICDDDFMHDLAKTGSSQYDVMDKNSSGYEEWDGWEDEESFAGRGLYIYESGSNTSNVEGTYDIDDEDWIDMGVSFDGVYNIDRTGASDDIGGSSSPLSSSDIAEISNNVSSSLKKDDAPERADVIAKALSLCGKVRYHWGGAWNKDTSDKQIMSTGLDCAAFVSYCAYKGTHENGNHLNIGFSSVQHTAQLKSAGKDCGKNLRPGDVLVKIQGKDSQGHYRCHAVMYIGATSGGKFTIVEESGSRGAHLSYYSSYKDFEARRGDGVGYQYHRNLFGD